MQNLNDSTIVKQAEIDKNHIDNYQLETTVGTKRTKEKFYVNAVEHRNIYIAEQKQLFEDYKKILENEMRNRVKNFTPEDKTTLYDEELLDVSKLLNLVLLNSEVADSFKLRIDFLVASITDNTSLEELNNIIKLFVDCFKENNILLSVEDFKYTMFTEEYMYAFFKNSDNDSMKEVFEKIYFACPDIKLQLKMNLSYIIKQYKSQLSKSVVSLNERLYKEFDVTDKTVIDKYVSTRFEVGLKIARDEYYNFKMFIDGSRKIADYLEGAPARTKNYNMFAVNGDYASLSEEEKKNYNTAMMDLYVNLNELKKYYHYEFIIKDLLERFKNKESAKSTYVSKKKEVEKEEKNRLNVYKEYLKANGIGFLAKKDNTKIKNSMLKMNEHIKKLAALYDELRDLEITYNLNKLNESASIYDLLKMSLTSFNFLEKKFMEDEYFQDKKLEDNVDDYFKFIYNPSNNFLRKINVLTDYNIVSIVADKYKLLKLNITEEMIDPDNIDATMSTVEFINLIQNIEESKISLDNIDDLCKMIKITFENENNLEQ